ncbi:hypothetical protein DFH09DRAFT_1467837 [Mycena vulgaris]|nr:hypothetical protein DFH09DRAFT_1467837 [Mycena vulgaris]
MLTSLPQLIMRSTNLRSVTLIFREYARRIHARAPHGPTHVCFPWDLLSVRFLRAWRARRDTEVPWRSRRSGCMFLLASRATSLPLPGITLAPPLSSPTYATPASCVLDRAALTPPSPSFSSHRPRASLRTSPPPPSPSATRFSPHSLPPYSSVAPVSIYPLRAPVFWRSSPTPPVPFRSVLSPPSSLHPISPRPAAAVRLAPPLS